MDITSPINLDELTSQATALRTQSDPRTTTELIDAERDRFRRQFTFDNTYVGNEAAETQFLDDVATKHDNTLVANLKLWDLGHASALAEVDQELAASQAPPQERDPLLHELRVLNLREQFRGRRLADVVALYRSIDDTSNPSATRLIETNREAWQLTPDNATDAQAAIELKQLIAERRAAREPKDLREKRAQLIGLRTSSLSALIQYAKDGTLAVATVQHGRRRVKSTR